jgi:hypothetical protein
MEQQVISDHECANGRSNPDHARFQKATEAVEAACGLAPKLQVDAICTDASLPPIEGQRL